jgi:hypothetical protein
MVSAAFLILVALPKADPPVEARAPLGGGAERFTGNVIQYGTSFSPFSAIIFWNCATILSMRLFLIK